MRCELTECPPDRLTRGYRAYKRVKSHQSQAEMTDLSSRSQMARAEVSKLLQLLRCSDVDEPLVYQLPLKRTIWAWFVRDHLLSVTTEAQ